MSPETAHKTKLHKPRSRRAAVDPNYSPNIREAPEARLSRSLEYGLAMLECFSVESPTLGIADMADMLSLTRSTTHRYALTLMVKGLLEQDSSRKYRLAAGVADVGLSMLTTIAVRAGAHPALEELREQTAHTASLGVLDGARAMYVQRAHSHGPGQYQADMDLGAGVHVPLHCTALGKALLASQPTELQEELMADIQLTQKGPNTITVKSTLLEQLARIGSKGFAVSDEEHAAGVRSLALAVPDPTERHVLAVELTVPAADCSQGQLTRRFGPALRAAAQRMSTYMQT
jgi:IclR family pca regulon transcriptional regulator